MFILDSSQVAILELCSEIKCLSLREEVLCSGTARGAVDPHLTEAGKAAGSVSVCLYSELGLRVLLSHGGSKALESTRDRYILSS